MKEKFEHKLTNRIREVFDSHKPEFNPQDWEQMETMLVKKKDRMAPLLNTFMKAAIVLILIGTGSYFLWDQSLDKSSGGIEHTGSTKGNLEREFAIEDTPPIRDSAKSFSHAEILEERQAEAKIGKEMQEEKPKLISDDHLREISSIGSQKVDIVAQADIIVFEPDDISLSQTLDYESVTISSEIPVKDVSLVAKSDGYSTWSAEDHLKEYGSQQNNEKKFRMGFELASFTNYSGEELSPGVNYGGGITFQIPVINRLSFNPGLTISSQNLDYNNDIELSVNEFTAMSLGDIQSYASSTRTKPSEVDLTAMDVPVNFQYQFIQRPRSGYFVELGFSNLVYLSQNYYYTVTASGPAGIQSQTVEVDPIDEKVFDFAKFINFSLGWDYRLSRGFALTFNPYMQYPVGTSTSRDIQFGSGGLKLKFMIIPKK
jgi:hypothetical protein